jgi:V/A-type H+-transporting ATPase subunit A
MQDNNSGTIVGVNGNMLTVEFDTFVTQNEVAYAITGEERLKCEVIRIRGKLADLQVFEATGGLKVGDKVEFTDELLSVELGPGLLTRVFDGLQNPLNDLAEVSGFFLQRGLYLPALDYEAKWEFTPMAEIGTKINAGDYLGYVNEGIFKHYIMAPFGLKEECEVVEITAAGSYTIAEKMALLKTKKGEEITVTMVQNWPVKIPISTYK